MAEAKADARQTRLKTLSERFSPQDVQATEPTEVKRKSKAESNNRKRHSVYIDADLMKRIDILYKEMQHTTYPIEFTKSLFLEKLIEKGIKDLAEIKASIIS
jgi:hypothetical protein